MQKLGMKPEGVQRQKIKKWGEYLDTHPLRHLAQ
jgi:RimJ/RimL family protein N-acetyltransferase